MAIRTRTPRPPQVLIDCDGEEFIRCRDAQDGHQTMRAIEREALGGDLGLDGTFRLKIYDPLQSRYAVPRTFTWES